MTIPIYWRDDEIELIYTDQVWDGLTYDDREAALICNLALHCGVRR